VALPYQLRLGFDYLLGETATAHVASGSAG
jgi:hypothetical protein